MPSKKSEITDAQKQSVKAWYPILNWPELPNFSSCHNIEEYSKFVDYYYVCTKISLLEENISELLRSGIHTSSVRLMGVPGAGKTTFLYYLMKKAIHENGDIIGKYYFHIFHANKANDADYDRIVMRRVKSAWKEYYIRCGQNETFRLLNARQDLSLKDQINWLADYYLHNKSLFNKTMIFIIDDVDTMDNEMAFNVARSVRTHLEVQSVIKWISIRNETYDAYPLKIKEFFSQFFPDVQTVPDVSLHAIIKYRIETGSANIGKNPFSRKLCDLIVSNLCNYNKRQALPLLFSILADVPPKEIAKSTSEEFIQKYIEKASVNALIEKEHLRNLHQPIYRNVYYPVPYEIMMCLMHTMSKRILFAAVRQVLIVKSKKSKRWPENSAIDLKMSQFNYTIDKLKEDQLITIDKDTIQPTRLGKVHHIYIGHNHYNEKCLDRVPEIDRNENYEDLLSRNVDYAEQVRLFTSLQFDE